ncbi:glutamine synthetase family protein [Ornithinimicrobium tianjinense]|uniref:Glutamine synthetase n=1 Tax=Ornithinimicrobium tianjinense TaxID=1195761 RepID=A0A917BU01_9MICO|nr:glutamine synthetase family protein [Ornithinimicrobium tianjinense]GGF58663.1 glutamine synthetase [Ornithinimicrobium tianjinense]
MSGADTAYLTPLTFVATTDLTGITKGRSLATEDLRPDGTVGWVPANLGIGASGHIVDEIPFGSTGDLRLRPDPAASTLLTGVPGRPDTTVVMADIVHTDGRPWACCPRTFLKDAVRDLEAEFGITVRAGFEHEFTDLDAEDTHHPFSWRNFRAAEPMGSQLITAMKASGLEPENWLPEYGDHQFEITVRPADPVAAADRAVLTRDLVRDVFRAAGHRTTFSPMVRPDATGNGVHVHFGLDAADGGNVFWDPERPGRLSETGNRFASGIVHHARALAAFFAPLTVSYQRLRPHHWSSAGVFLGLENREALVRLCPTVEIDGRDPEPQLHLEFRGGDIGANPYLLLGLLLRAGLQGLRGETPQAELKVGEIDPEQHPDVPSLPTSLDEALEALETDEVVRGWFAPELVTTYLRLKRVEIAEVGALDDAAQCAWYREVY